MGKNTEFDYMQGLLKTAEDLVQAVLDMEDSRVVSDWQYQEIDNLLDGLLWEASDRGADCEVLADAFHRVWPEYH